MKRMRGGLALAAVAVIAVGACSSSGGSAAPSLPTTVGDGEGALNVVAWAGYVVGGTGGEQVEGYDWVTPFEDATGCKVTVKVGLDSANMVQLMKTGEYDGVSASGDATLRLIAGGDVSPVNFDLIPNYKDVYAGLKGQSYNTVNGLGYGVPHGRGANLLMWNPDAVQAAPDSWNVVFDADSPYKGKVTAYNYAIYIADAAVYLMATKPDLGIKNPYSLDETQLAAAVDLLKQQRTLIGKYWVTAQEEIDGFANGDMTIGTSWQYQANVINSVEGGVKVETVKPKEGTTGWSDTWMISSKAAHPNCMYKWMDWITSPAVNAQVAEYFGEAPAQTKACEHTSQKDFCDIYHATDEKFASEIHYWTTPQKQCVDGSGDNCTAYDEWVDKWQQIKG